MYQVNMLVSKLTDISHIFTHFFSKVMNLMCSTFHCDDMFCALLPQVKLQFVYIETKNS